MHYKNLPILSFVSLLMMALTGCQQESNAPEATQAIQVKSVEQKTTDVVINPQKNIFFGELHVHTVYSLDAYLGGSALTPDEAYRFAKGKAIQTASGEHRISQPLDFLAITDHAEYLGEMYSALHKDAPGHGHELITELLAIDNFSDRESWFLKYVVGSNRSSTPRHPPFYAGETTAISAWQLLVDRAEQHNDPGTFTTIHAFEWSAAPNGGNLHRNIFFRDTNLPERPMSYIDINREEELWDWMAVLEEQGMRVIAMPHNSNASKNMMFPDVDSSGNPLTPEYAKMRNRFEVSIEMMQIKGNSEVHRFFWQQDEFADFENADSIQNYSERTFVKNNFVRAGLALGLRHRAKLGTNPFEYGIVGGTDNHNGNPSNVTESNFANGSHGGADGTVARRRDAEVGGWIDGKDLSPGSITGIWAESNTRGALWDAMQAKETYSTSGPRIKLRLFAGFDLAQSPKNYSAFVEQGFANGQPMGKRFQQHSDKPMVINVWASKDANGANLDRIQIIKSSLSIDGKPAEKIYEVVWSDDRELDQNGKLPAVGNTVDLTSATYTNTIGATELLGSWVDPDFDANAAAVYYIRVLEIPTPRWTTYDAVRSGLPLLEGVEHTIQERAWSSPIWYYPAS